MQSLRLVNSSGNPVRMHIMHPQTPHFAISIGRNGAGKRGRVMPGMAEEVTVVCKPTELRYYRDTIRVHIEGGEDDARAGPRLSRRGGGGLPLDRRLWADPAGAVGAAHPAAPLGHKRRVRLQGRRRHRPRRLRHRADEPASCRRRARRLSCSRSPRAWRRRAR